MLTQTGDRKREKMTKILHVENCEKSDAAREMEKQGEASGFR